MRSRKAATDEHAAIADALETGDMDEARRLMRQHVMHSRAFVEHGLEDAGS